MIENHYKIFGLRPESESQNPSKPKGPRNGVWWVNKTRNSPACYEGGGGSRIHGDAKSPTFLAIKKPKGQNMASEKRRGKPVVRLKPRAQTPPGQREKELRR